MISTFAAFMLGIGLAFPIGVLAGWLWYHVQHEHYRRHHDRTGYPHLLWSRHLSRVVAEDEAKIKHFNIAT